MSQVDQYREGYEQAKADGVAERMLSATLNIMRDSAYNEGYLDAANDRPFSPPYDDD